MISSDTRAGIADLILRNAHFIDTDHLEEWAGCFAEDGRYVVTTRENVDLGFEGAQRAPSLPGVPTVAESGFPGYNVTTWFGLGVPLGTPPEIVRRLTSEVNNALNQPDVMERLIAIGAVPRTMSAEQFGKFWRDERDRWGQIVRESGAKPD